MKNVCGSLLDSPIRFMDGSVILFVVKTYLIKRKKPVAVGCWILFGKPLTNTALNHPGCFTRLQGNKLSISSLFLKLDNLGVITKGH